MEVHLLLVKWKKEGRALILMIIIYTLLVVASAILALYVCETRNMFVRKSALAVVTITLVFGTIISSISDRVSVSHIVGYVFTLLGSIIVIYMYGKLLNNNINTMRKRKYVPDWFTGVIIYPIVSIWVWANIVYFLCNGFSVVSILYLVSSAPVVLMFVTVSYIERRV